MIKRAQVVVRQIGKSQSDSYRNPHAAIENRHDYVAVGIAEVPVDGYPQHVVRGFASMDELSFTMTDFQRPLADSGEACDIGDLCLQRIWPRPNPVTQLSGGGLILRDTRMPASEGHRIVLVLMVMSLKARLQHHHLYSLAGDIHDWELEDHFSLSAPGEIILSDPVDPGTDMTGMALNSILKLPIWGWGKEKVVFVSTMDLPTIDRCSRLAELQQHKVLTGDEQHELAALERSAAGRLMAVSAADEQYQRFKKRLIREVGLQPWDRVKTASEMERESAIASRIVRELMEENA